MRLSTLMGAASWFALMASVVVSAQTTAGPVYSMADGVSRPVPLKRVEPQYPAGTQAARIQGTVTVDLVVLTDGTAGDVRVARSLDPILDEEAIRAVREWRFRPGMKDGRDVPVRVSIEVGFALREPAYKPGDDGVSLPVPVKQVDARYPEDAQSAGIQGVVTVECVVLPDGTVGRTSVIAAVEPELDEEAIQAIKQWRFTPGMKDGRPVPVQVSINVSFAQR